MAAAELSIALASKDLSQDVIDEMTDLAWSVVVNHSELELEHPSLGVVMPSEPRRRGDVFVAGAGDSLRTQLNAMDDKQPPGAELRLAGKEVS